MNEEQQLLRFLRDLWPPGLLDQLRRGVWVAVHEALSEADDMPATPVHRAWLLTHLEALPRSAASYRLFAQSRERPGAGGCFERGSARIAAYPTPGEYYLDYQAAPLWGEGMRVSVDAGTVTQVRGLWKA